MAEKKILLFIEEGVGNIIQVIPTCIAISKLGYTVDIALRCNYSGLRRLLQIEEINNVYNLYVEEIPDSKSYEKVILTEFGHLNHYKDWKSAFDGVEIVQDSELSKDLGKMNDVEINMRFARDLGYEGPIPEVKLNYPSNKTFQYFDNIICPGSGSYNKRWPYFMDLAKKLKGRVGIVGGPKEDKVNWPPNCVDMSGLLELDEIASIISKAGVYIGNDSGITHLANGTGTPCVVIWGPTNLIKCKPWNNPVAIVSKGYPCQPCVLIQSETKCEKEKKPRACLMDVTVNEVVDAISKVKDCIDYRDETDYEKYWNSRYSLDNDKKSSEIIPRLKTFFETSKISGETCLDYGCGKGDYIPFLNHYYKKIDAVDIVSVKIPELNGVVYHNIKEKTDVLHSNHDLLFFCDVLSWIPPFIKTQKHTGFKRIVIVDKIDGVSATTNKKQRLLKLESLKKEFGIDLEVKETIELTNGEKYSILYGEV